LFEYSSHPRERNSNIDNILESDQVCFVYLIQVNLLSAPNGLASGAAAGRGSRHSNYRLISGRVHPLSGAGRCRRELVLARFMHFMLLACEVL
jgi:hypothetical protein